MQRRQERKQVGWPQRRQIAANDDICRGGCASAGGRNTATATTGGGGRSHRSCCRRLWSVITFAPLVSPTSSSDGNVPQCASTSPVSPTGLAEVARLREAVVVEVAEFCVGRFASGALEPGLRHRDICHTSSFGHRTRSNRAWPSWSGRCRRRELGSLIARKYNSSRLRIRLPSENTCEQKAERSAKQDLYAVYSRQKEVQKRSLEYLWSCDG